MGWVRRIARRLRARYRSAVTGRFVSKDYADRHPDITIKERQ